MKGAQAHAAEMLWTLLRAKGADGLTATDAARDLDINAGYARVRMRAWERAGFVSYYPPETLGRTDSGHFVMAVDAPEKSPIVAKSGAIDPREGYMTPQQFAVARRLLGYSLAQMARALGRTGMQPTLTRAMRRIESGQTPIDAATAEKIRGLMAQKI